MATRTAKLKATIIDAPAVEIPELSAKDYLFSQIPDDWRRRTVALAVGTAVSFGAGYLIGIITEYAIVGALLLTGSAFVGLMILLLGLIIAMYVGAECSMFAYTGIMTKQADKLVDSVRGFFARTPQGVTA